MANEIVKETLHPDNNDNIDIYPKTSYDQVEGRPDLTQYQKKSELESDIEKLGFSKANNLENGTGTGSIQQKSATYDQMINDFEPNMAAYIIAKNGGTVPANIQEYLAALQSSTIATSEAIITILDTRRNDINTVITNFKTLPSPYADYGIDNLVAGQLANYRITPSSDLSNIVGEAGDVSAVFGLMNKVFAPGTFAGGVNSEAGDKGYPSETMGAFAYGSNVKVKSKWAIGFGRNLLNSGDESAVFGRDLENSGNTSAVFGEGDKEYKIYGLQVDKDNRRRYLDNLAKAGGTVTGIGEDRVGVTGINKGKNNFMSGYGHYIGDGAVNNTVVGNQNIISKTDANRPNRLCASNFISGFNNFIDLSVSSGITGVCNQIRNSETTFLAGRYLSAENRLDKTVIGKFNEDKADTHFEVGNGTSDNDRKNAFEVLKDGTIRVPNFNSNGTQIGMATLKVINGVLTVIV